MFGFISSLFSRFFRNADDDKAQSLYWQIVELSRTKDFYTDYKIPDTIDGRFDCLLVHIFLVMSRLNELGYHKISQKILKIFVNDMDRSLRMTGVGDHSIARKMRKVGEAYSGRITAYQHSINDFSSLKKTIHKNIYRLSDVSEETIHKMGQYVLEYKQALERHTQMNMSLPNTPFLRN